MIVDAHVYVGDSLFGTGQNIDDLLREMDKLRIDQSVLVPNRPRQYDLLPANRMVAELVERHPDRLYGWARIDPWQGEEALRQLKQAVEEMALIGLALHPWEEHFQISDRLVDPLMEYAAQQRFPVLVEMGYPLLAHPMDLAELARRHSDVTFIGTHGLQLDSAAFALRDAETVMRECGNIIMESSGMYAPEVMENIVKELGADRLIFGSHAAWLNLEFELARIQYLKINKEQKNDVCCNNILRLINH